MLYVLELIQTYSTVGVQTKWLLGFTALERMDIFAVL